MLNIISHYYPMADELSQRIPAGLRVLLETGEFVLFLGAGVGIEAGLADWKSSLFQIADQVKPLQPMYSELIRAEAEAARFLQAAELLYLAPLTDG